jgi:hypothetical protein
MGWKRLGRVYVPDATQAWARSHASLPIPVHIEDDLFRVFFSARDDNKRSHVGWFDIEISFVPRLLRVSDSPVLSPGEDGAFDDSGVSIGSIVRSLEGLRLYYMGWNIGVRSRWRNAIGLALASSPGESFERFSPGPILDRSPQDPYTLSYPSVLHAGPKDWRMWYGSNLTAGLSNADMSHVVKYATSSDGLNWRRDGATVVGFSSPGEYAIARPSVVQLDNSLLMCFACRGDNYRIKAALSTDGIVWTRVDEQFGLDPSSEGWDSEMTCYPTLFWHRGRLWIFYNGNSYGATGVGLAVWDGDLSTARGNVFGN